MHATAIRYAIRFHFRLMRDHLGRYFLLNAQAQRVDCPAWGETTAAGAIRMMRRHVRLGLTECRAGAA